MKSQLKVIIILKQQTDPFQMRKVFPKNAKLTNGETLSAKKMVERGWSLLYSYAAMLRFEKKIQNFQTSQEKPYFTPDRKLSYRKALQKQKQSNSISTS